MKARLAIVLAFACCSMVLAEEPKEKEDEKLKGMWVLTSLEKDGKSLPGEKDEIVVISAGKITTGKPNDQAETRYKVDSTKNPKTIDITPETADLGVIRGIYQIEGDVLKICTGQPGKERPTRFETKPDSGHSLAVLKRKK